MKSADLKQHALKLLEMSKKFLAEDGGLDPTAFIITAGDQILRPIELENEGAKFESCKKIVEEAQRRKALAIITIFLARSADFSEKDFDQASYSWGDIQYGSTDRSITLLAGMMGTAVFLSWRCAGCSARRGCYARPPLSSDCFGEGEDR